MRSFLSIFYMLFSLEYPVRCFHVYHQSKSMRRGVSLWLFQSSSLSSTFFFRRNLNGRGHDRVLTGLQVV